MTLSRAPAGPLRELARLYGLQTSYYDVDGRRQEASPRTLLPALRALGAPVESDTDVPAALRERRQALWRRALEPVTVVWDGSPTETELRIAGAMVTESADCELILEEGDVRAWKQPLSNMATLRRERVEGVEFTAKRLKLPARLPMGYHRLSVTLGGVSHDGLVVSAPSRAYEDKGARQAWGLFVPLYTLNSARSWGAGDFSDLRAFIQWVADLGGSVVATLPFLATFLDEPYEPSPYAPVSRLFWNEFYVDVTAAPELEQCPDEQATVASLRSGPDLSRLRSQRLVDYRRVMALKRGVLEHLARRFFEDRSPRHDAFDKFLGEHPEVEDYARFRAVGERLKTPWPQWPSSLRNGVVRPADYDDTAKRYHLYVQWLAQEQLTEVARVARARGVALHLDFPLGTNAAGYDVWRERSLFVQGASAGAPPDMFFPNGQNWGFQVPDPWAQREQSYRYFIASLRHHLQHAGSLRVDHVMSLHRLFCIPKGLDAQDGVYVHYPAEELYAILSLESHRHGAAIVGENLGTVPSHVNSAMIRHNLQRMYVAQFELSPKDRPLGPVPRNAIASLNTHDTPPFAAYWQERDIDDRLRLGLVDEAEARKERRYRQRLRTAVARSLVRRYAPAGVLKDDDTRAALRGCLRFLAGSRARMVLINLEDLWLESRWQNMPGTSGEYPNWRRKARYGLDAIRRMPEVRETLQEVNRLRRRARGAA